MLFRSPGVVGKLGTLLGQNGINITRMQLGVSGKSETPAPDEPAIALLNLDRPLDEAQLDKLRALAPIRRAAQMI